MISIVDQPGINWHYFKFTPGWNIHLEEYGKDQYEIIVLVCTTVND